MTAKRLSTSLTLFLIENIKPQLKWFLCIAILPIAWALDQIAFPYCIKLLIDAITYYSGDKTLIYSHIASILCFGALLWIFLILIWRFLDIVDIYFIPKFQAIIRFKMLKYIEQHSHQYFSEEFSGSLSNKISDITSGSWEILFFVFREFLPVSFTILISIVVIGMISPIFSILFTLFYFSHMIICFKLSKKISTLSDIHSESRSTLSGNIVDSLSNIINIRLFSKHAYELLYLRKYQEIEINKHKTLLWGLFNVRLILEAPSFLMMIGIVYYLISGWQKGYITPGDFAFVISLAFNIMMSVWRLGWALPNFFKEVGSCHQALKLITIPHQIIDISQAGELIVTKGEIKFNQVYFRYTEDKPLFENKNVCIRPGEKVGLVGFTGSGKSTFVNLILRYYDVHNGEILIDEQNIAKVTQNSLRNNIAMVTQDVTLFHRSIKENIGYGKLHANDDEIIDAAKKAHCHEFIQHLELGYETIVGERGVKLSGGQRQCIAIARAILKNSPIIILDEATSALDTLTERYIQDSIKELIKSRTAIIIAHRLSTLLEVDRILVFQSGRIIEQGTHHELLLKKGHYSQLWSMHVGGFLTRPTQDTTQLA